MTAFRARPSTQQALTSGGTELNFGTIMFDADGGMGASRFTLPTNWENKNVRFWAGITTATNESNTTLRIQYSTNSGSTWTTLSESNRHDNPLAVTTTTPALQFATADTLFRVMVINVNGNTSSTHQRTFFAGAIVDEYVEFEAVEARISVNDVIGSGQFVITDFDTAENDTASFLDTSVGRIVIPEDSPSFLCEASVGHDATSYGYWGGYIQQSRDGGSSFGGTFDGYALSVATDNPGGHAALGVVHMVATDQIRGATFNSGGNTLLANDNTYLTARFWRHEIPFNPYAHFDLSQGDYTTSSTDITVIPDQTNNGRDLDLSDGGAWPQTGRTLNGLDVAEFDAGGDIIYGNDFDAFANTDQPYTIAMVVKLDNTIDFQHLCAFHTSAADEYHGIAVNDAITYPDWGVNKRDTGGVTDRIASGFDAYAYPVVLVITSDGTTVDGWANGEKIFQNVTQDEGTMTGVTHFSMGNLLFNGSLNTGLDGVFGEAIIYSRKLSYGDCRVLTNHLSAKWGTANAIDEGHRYWRLIGTADGSNDSGGLAEVEFYTQIDGVDVTVEGTPISGSEGSGTDDQAFDGNKTTSFWDGSSGSIATDDSWIGYDFGLLFKPNITQFEITARDTPDSDQVWDEWDLAYSDDGVAWTVVQSYTDTDAWTSNESRKYRVDSTETATYVAGFQLGRTTNMNGLSDSDIISWDDIHLDDGVGLSGTVTTITVPDGVSRVVTGASTRSGAVASSFFGTYLRKNTDEQDEFARNAQHAGDYNVSHIVGATEVEPGDTIEIRVTHNLNSLSDVDHTFWWGKFYA